MAISSEEDVRAGERAELALVQSIMGIVMPVAKRMAALSGVAAGSNNFTAYEASCFNKYNYLGYTEAFVATMLAFSGLFGGMRFVSYRLFLKHRALPSSTSYHMKASAQRHQYAALEQAGKPNRAMRKDTMPREEVVAPKSETIIKPPESDSEFKFYSSEAWTQFQLMCAGSIALLVGSIVANIGIDSNRMFKDIAEIPNKPGISELSRQICPAVVDKYKELLAAPTVAPLQDAYLREHPDVGPTEEHTDFAIAVRQKRPRELLAFPVTEQLESAVNLVENCRRRIEFEEECRRRNHRVDPVSGLVDIPEPGVPVKFVRLPDLDI